jgi:hypothetical protein
VPDVAASLRFHTSTAVETQVSTAPTQRLWFAAALGLVAVVWFTALSGWLGITSGSVLLSRQNVLFNSDTNTWVDEMVNNHHAPSASGRAIHPLMSWFWRPPTQLLSSVLRLWLPREQAGVMGTRLLVAIVAGAGVGSLAWVALALGTPPHQCVLMLMMYLLFTTNSTAALPEHFGISNGLLSIVFAVSILASNRAVRSLVLAVLACLCLGTTLTNVLYPLAALYQWSVRSSRTRKTIIAAAAAAMPIAIFLFVDSRKVVLLYTDANKDIASQVAVLPAHIPGITRWYLKTTQIHGHVGDYLNLRLVKHPLDAATYAVFAVVAPAIGPSPKVRRTKGADMVTYESSQPLHWNPNGYFTGSDGVSLRAYSSVQGIGAALWLGLLVLCAFRTFNDPSTRRLGWLPAAWILFSLVFHNLWGDELFLYAPHWSWALMALVLIGARHMSRSMVAAFVIPIMLCQSYTLFEIKNALLRLS